MEDISTLVTGIDYKVRKLIARNQQVTAEVDRLSREIELLNKKISEQEQTIKDKEEKSRVLTLVKTLETKEGNVEAKAKINELVREIDKCIGILNT